MQSDDAVALAAALPHPRIANDPYARLRALDQLHRLAPHSSETQHHWLQAMLLGNRPQPVWNWFDDALQTGTLSDQHLLLAAQVAQVSGARDKARDLYLRRIRDHPMDVDAWQKYAEFDAPHLSPHALADRLRDLLARVPDAYSAEKLQFALSACLLQTDPQQAFALASAAQQLKRKRLPHWRADQVQQRLRNDLQLAQSCPRPRALAKPGMVFIVGMPRSGTTLLSSLLGAHSAMGNVGEQNLVPSLAMRTVGESATPLSAAFVDFANRWYRAATADLCPDGTMSVDKLPSNIEHCGFILACFPTARIIHIRRETHDCAVSIHLRDFDFGCTYATSADDIARYHAFVSDHARHVARLHPGRMATVDFEDLVSSPEPTLETLLGQLGLDWEPRILDFWKKTQSTATFSESQVRRPLNADGLGLARRVGDAAADFLRRHDQAHANTSSAP